MTQEPICIAYFSGSGHTTQIAEALATDMRAVRLIDVDDISAADWAALDAAPTIVFGAPTYMGSTAAKFGLFLEVAAERWMELAWQDKLAAGFTVATHPSGDKLAALQRLSVFAAQMGMIWVGQTAIGAPVFPERAGLNTDGSWLGLMARDSGRNDGKVIAQDLETARIFGRRIRAATERWG